MVFDFIFGSCADMFSYGLPVSQALERDALEQQEFPCWGNGKNRTDVRQNDEGHVLVSAPIVCENGVRVQFLVAIGWERDEQEGGGE